MTPNLRLIVFIAVAPFVYFNTLEAQSYPPSAPSPSHTSSPNPTASAVPNPMNTSIATPPNNSANPLPTVPGIDCLQALGGPSSTTSTETDSDGFEVVTTVDIKENFGKVKRVTLKEISFHESESSLVNFVGGAPQIPGQSWVDEAIVRCSTEIRYRMEMKIEQAPLRSYSGSCIYAEEEPNKVYADYYYTGDYDHQFFIPRSGNGRVEEFAPYALLSYKQFMGDKVAFGSEFPRIWKTDAVLVSPSSGNGRYDHNFEQYFTVDNSGQFKLIRGHSIYDPVAPDYECSLRDEIQNQTHGLVNCNAPDAAGHALLRGDFSWIWKYLTIHGAISDRIEIAHGLENCKEGRPSIEFLLDMYYAGQS